MTATPQTNTRAPQNPLPAPLAFGLLFSLCFASFPSSAARAQTPAAAAPAATQSQEPSSFQRRPLGIENNQPDPHEEYTLGPGDTIAVEVTGRPELSGTQVVGPDGRITIPVVGSVLVGDKTRDAAAKTIDEALAKDYSGTMTSTVQVTKYGSNHILLLGAIEKPGLIAFDQPPTLLEVITMGGHVLTPDKNLPTPRRCVIYRGDSYVMNVNISDRFDGQRALNDIRLRRNDIVFIPEHQENVVSVLGEVNKPGPVQLLPSSTLVSLLASAGGPTEKAGGNPKITITESSTGRIQEISFKQLLTLHGGSDVALHDGDIVYVPRSGLAKVGFIMQQVAPITGLASAFALTSR
jgi:polysaccharide export outer membrane protein